MAAPKKAAPAKLKHYVIVQLDGINVDDYESEVFENLDVAKAIIAEYPHDGWVIAEIILANKVTKNVEVVPYNA